MLHGGLWAGLCISETADVPTQPHRVYREWKKRRKYPVKKKKKKKKENFTITVIPFDDNKKLKRQMTDCIKPKCISLRCSRQTRGNRNLMF